MKNLSFLLLILSSAKCLYAQNTNLVVGPCVGIDQFLSVPKLPAGAPGIDKNTLIYYKAGYLYGLESSYMVNRVMFNARLLTTKRVYDVTGFINHNPAFPVHVSVRARYFSVPLTVSYLVKTVYKIQLYVGGGVVPEWISGNFDRISYAVVGSGRAYQLDPEKPNAPFSLGGSLQLIARYNINEQIILQAQPSFHYFSNTRTPFATTNNSAFSISLTAGYKIHK